MYKLIWKGEEIDSFYNEDEANEMLNEYNLAYGGGVTLKKQGGENE